MFLNKALATNVEIFLETVRNKNVCDFLYPYATNMFVISFIINYFQWQNCDSNPSEQRYLFAIFVLLSFCLFIAWGNICDKILPSQLISE